MRLTDSCDELHYITNRSNNRQQKKTKEKYNNRNIIIFMELNYFTIYIYIFKYHLFKQLLLQKFN